MFANSKKYLTVIILLAFVLILPIKQVFAQSISELQSKINEKNRQIQEIEKEIAGYQNQINETGKQAQTLQNTIKTLDITRSKLQADIKLTENKIDSTQYTIEQLGTEIGTKQERISENKEAIKEAIRQIQQNDDISFVEIVLSQNKITDVWNEIDTLEQFQRGIAEKVKLLEQLKNDLQDKKTDSEREQQKLKNLRNQLSDQKKIADANKAEKDKLLKETKNQESAYKKLLAQKEALRDSFENELLEFESQLKIAIDPKSIPSAGKGVLAWPLDNVLITQYFGNTEFSKTTNAYNGHGHNGLDFRASIGTRILSAANGVVEGFGDTDKVCPNASYGKWVLIRHNNGLSTLYAHLSLIKVGVGQNVSRGEVIGYSGNTGYATGPHLHFTVYATQGVRIMDRQSRVCGGVYTMPIADLKAYLNPLEYL